MEKTSKYIAALLGLLILVLFITLLWLGDLRLHIPPFLIIYAGIFFSYLAAIYFVLGVEKPEKKLLIYIFLIAALCRGVQLATGPVLSDDIYRYLWDGRVAASGINPYRYPPNHPSLEFLRDANYQEINHKHLETLYPPLTQSVFLTGVLLKSNLLTLKIIFVFFDLATLLVIFLILYKRKRNPALCIIYAWNPLVIMEFAHSGHLDSLAIFFLMLGIFLLDQRKGGYGFLSLAFSFLSKYLSAILLPYFILKKKYIGRAGIYLLAVCVGYLPFLDAGSNLFSSLKVYAADWEFNSAPFTILRYFIGDANVVRGILLSALVVFSFYQGHRQEDFLKYSYLIIGFALFLAPTLHPWYLCWIVPFLCFFPNRAWIVFTGLVTLSYWVWVDYGMTGSWSLKPQILWLEYLPFYVLLVYEATHRKIRDQWSKICK